MPIEQCFTVDDVKDTLKVSYEKARLMVKDVPGVLRILPEPSDGISRRRQKTMYRIPESVFVRIVRRLANPAA